MEGLTMGGVRTLRPSALGLSVVWPFVFLGLAEKEFCKSGIRDQTRTKHTEKLCVPSRWFFFQINHAEISKILNSSTFPL